MRRVNSFFVIILVMVLCTVLCAPVYASSGFDAGLIIERSQGVISVTVQDSTVLHDKQPTLSIPCEDASFNGAMMFFEGVAAAVTYKDGYVSFKVAKGGTYHIVAGQSPTDEKKPTCTEDGAYLYQFDGQVYAEIIKATGHDFSDTSKDTCANCEEPNPDYSAPQDPPSVIVPPVIPNIPAEPAPKPESEVAVKTDGDRTVVEIPAEVAQSGETVTLPVPVVSVVTDRAEAPIITVTTNNTENTSVEIPVVEPTPGTVVVIVDKDGNETIVLTSVVTENGVVADLPDGATVKVVDNAKNFIDVKADSWHGAAIGFVSSRELFLGVSDEKFDTKGKMTCGMLMTVLARLDGHDTTAEEGEHWQQPGVDWAVENGIHSGEGADENITREEIALMLWKYAGSPETTGSLEGFVDADEASEEALMALAWAVENGVMQGMGNSVLNPAGEATRAQVAQFLKNFIERI